MKVNRWRVLPRGVTPLELWDWPVGTELFCQRIGAPRVFELRRQGRPEREIAGILAADLIEIVEGLRRPNPLREEKALREGLFDLLYLTGGLTELEGFRQAVGSEAAAFRVAFGKEGRFGGEAGGELLLVEQGHRGGVVVDVGQTAIKCSIVSAVGSRTARRLYERDERALTRQPAEASREISAGQARARGDAALGWVAESVTQALSSGPPAPPALVLALPCALDEAARPGSSTYAGWEGDDTLVDRLLQDIGARVVREPSLTFHPWRHADHIEVFVLNDAELAALSARFEQGARAAAGSKALVLTLGFGPGAALIEFTER